MQGLQAPAAFPGYLPSPSLALLPSDRLGFNHRLSPFPSGCLGSFQQLRNKSHEPTFPFGKEDQPHLQPLRNDFISDVRPRRPSGSWRSTKEILTSFPPFSPNPSSWLPTKDFRKFPFISCWVLKSPKSMQTTRTANDQKKYSVPRSPTCAHGPCPPWQWPAGAVFLPVLTARVFLFHTLLTRLAPLPAMGLSLLMPFKS